MSNRTLVNTAQNVMNGTVSRGATWYEDVELTQNDAPLTGVDGFLWEMTFRQCEGDTTTLLTLTTADSTLTVLEDTDVTLLKIRCASTRLSALCGDYIADVRATDSATTVDGEHRILHYAHGTVTFVGDPPA